jgi:DNA polymerase III alpha subunit
MKAQLKVRTEYSFRTAYGPIKQVVDYLKSTGCEVAAITDRSSTFGHIQWMKYCKAANIKPLFGVELAFTPDLNYRGKRQELYWLTLIARNNAGLKEIYSAVEEATSNFYYVPRLPIVKLWDFSNDILVLSGNSGIGIHNNQLPPRVIVEAHSATNQSLLRLSEGTYLPVSDNYMITPSNRAAYEVLIGRMAYNRPSPMHILTKQELLNECSYLQDIHFEAAYNLAMECDALLAPATNILSDETKTLTELCILGAVDRELNLGSPEYYNRMKYELELISSKGFDDYFKVIADMVQYAKSQMLVGPARGSSCGSLVCYLLGITDIDPLKHGLIFERFIDITRMDLPDIDIDFQDDKRELVFDYLIEKYGPDKVAKLGTVSRYKARKAIGETAKAVRIPAWEAEQIADSIITRNDGDERADYCIIDSLLDTDISTRYPSIMVAAKLEAHARHAGTHAAGLVITNEPITNFVAKDSHSNRVMLDKYDCETINIMKVDALGLRTLSIIADCLAQIGWTKEQLLAYRLDEDSAYKILRSRLFSGVFQFTGRALQTLVRKINVEHFSDITAITALARPGPLISGASYEWCARRTGRNQVQYLHPMLEKITKETYGLIIYQEQVMQVAREIGMLSWEDTMALRKGMGKSLGQEYMDQWKDKFIAGVDNGKEIWEQVNTFGGYAFNKSHAVAYALVTYWCMVLKAKFPLQFALANLKFTVDANSVKQILREVDRMGYQFKVFDANKSQFNWVVKDNELIGGLINVKGIGDKIAKDILIRRANEIPLTDGQVKKLQEAKTKYDDVFEARTLFADLLANPSKYGIVSKLWNITDIEEIEGTYVFLAKVVSWKIRSLNEPRFMEERGGLRIPNDKWLTLLLEDDTDTIPATISRFNFARFGLPMTKEKLGKWYLFRGQVKENNRRIYIEKYKLV